MKFIVSLVVWFAVAAFPQQAPVNCNGPLTLQQLLALIQGQMPENRIVHYVQTCRLSFPVTTDALGRMVTAGAGSRTLAAVRAAEAPKSSGVQMEFVRIPAGEFEMGCSPGDGECDPDERPQRTVRITKGFEMGKYEVTQGQWEGVMGSNPSHFRGSNRPVERVTWADAQAFLRKLNERRDGYRYRLPTEAEWEYAARAGSKGKYYGELSQIGWFDGNADRQTHAVGEKGANGWGLHDMLGNVWEWCGDWKGSYDSGATVDPGGPATGQYRVLRGGSWFSVARDLRVSVRIRLVPGNRDVFRVPVCAGSDPLILFSFSFMR